MIKKDIDNVMQNLYDLAIDYLQKNTPTGFRQPPLLEKGELASSMFRAKNKNGYYPVFKSQPVQGTLAEVISIVLQKNQLHIAETEKYNHVTYFLNGGQDKKWDGEDWIVIPSNKVNSHSEMPEMKAKEVTDKLLEVLKVGEIEVGKNFLKRGDDTQNFRPNNQNPNYDYIIVNYANPDMVGHTGDIPASIRSMEFLDEQLGRLIEKVENNGHEMIIIADHGNMEFVGEYEENGQKLTDTEHNPNAVPCLFVGNNWKFENEVKLENQKKLLLENQKNLKTKGLCNPDIDLVTKVLSQKNQVNLENPENWLTQEEIDKIRPQLPLWYSGVLLLGLGE